jgi:uncharacterized membrane protein
MSALNNKSNSAVNKIYWNFSFNDIFDKIQRKKKLNQSKPDH